MSVLISVKYFLGGCISCVNGRFEVKLACLLTLPSVFS